MNTAFALAVLVWSAGAQPADAPTLAAPFSDHMVLQRNKPVPVWGWAAPNTTLTVTLGDQKLATRTDAQGAWKVTLTALYANATPQTLIVQAGEAITRVNDVLVGEVWLGSGQSNMAMTVARCQDFPKEQAAANHPYIRMFREESAASATPRATVRGSWVVCSPQSVGGFSGTLYFFGRDLHQKLQVPVGLINSSVGGTPIESWVSAEAQSRVPALKAANEAKAKAEAAIDREKARKAYETALARWKEHAAKAKAAGEPAPRKPIDPTEVRVRRGGPGGLFNGKINGLIPFAIRGVLWYQGEANTQPADAGLYQLYLTTLVTDWRSRWNEELPFAWVQLPNFKREGDGWMLVREAMLKALEIPNTGMAITIDIGSPTNIHPANKQDVGKRLAMWALGTVYGATTVSTSGPLPAGRQVLRGGDVMISFKHADCGLIARGGPLAGFAIAGADGIWKPATARIEGNAVLVKHAEIPQPAAVRYGWADNPNCNLFNGAGLPASPFRMEKLMAEKK